MRSIRLQLIIMYVALILVVLTLAGTLIILQYRSQEEARAEVELRRYAELIENDLINVESDAADFGFWFDARTSTQLGSIIDSAGATIASDEDDNEGLLPAPFESTAIIEATQTGLESFIAGRSHPDSKDIVTRWMEFAKPVTSKLTGAEYIIYVRMDAESIYDGIKSMTNTFVLAVILTLVLTATLGAVFSGFLVKPIAELTAQAKELASGNLDVSLEVASRDELGQLTESFNHMALELKKSMSEMQFEKNKMEIVLYNMTDGVLAYDGAGNPIHANQIAEELLEQHGVRRMRFDEASKLLFPGIEINENKLDDLSDSTIHVGEKYLNVMVNSYRNVHEELEGIIIVLQDVTKHKKLDEMRRDFVANVSHEIRTPLTTIKSYAETLIDGAIETRDVAIDFLNVINGEVDRMTHIVRDLLELTSLDNRRLTLDIATVELNSLINETVRQQQMTARKLNKSVEFEEHPGEVFLNVDRQRIAQVLTNIISNSLKYSYEEAKVFIWCEQSRQYTRIFVRDNGMGIPKEDLRNIFERFYRVDKARSRALGGTGLGLSIAKEIMEAHGGGISAISEINKGTTMILRFPRKE